VGGVASAAAGAAAAASAGAAAGAAVAAGAAAGAASSAQAVPPIAAQAANSITRVSLVREIIFYKLLI